MIKILIADDHPLLAEGVKKTLESFPEFTVSAIVSNGSEAIEYVNSHLVDIILLDINMPVMDGIDCAKHLLKNESNLKVAMLSMYLEMSLVKNLLNIGVKGYMLKTIPPDELRRAILNIYAGEKYFNKKILSALEENEEIETIPYITNNLEEDLTEREVEIVKLIAEGFTNKEIGEKLFISPRTVDSHRGKIFKKLNVVNVAALIRVAFRNGILK